MIDLHTHTTASDGSMRPAELVRHASNNGLSAVAITDHDTIDGIKEALDEGRRTGVDVIPGVEISLSFEPDMHMLGYFFNGGYNNITHTLDELRKRRDERNPKIIKKLNEMGFDIKMQEVKKIAENGIVGRPHIANILVKKGYVASIEEAFDKYLGSGRPAYFKKDKLTPEEGIKEITKAGGLPVLAHPKHLNRSVEELDTLLHRLTAAGLKGIEAIYVDNSDEETENFTRLAEKHGLLVTGGSDFHGKYKPDIEIGRGRGNLYIPYSLIDKMKECSRKLYESLETHSKP
jgi:predicted metal-dependent phosphoesterase TrpH